MKDRKESEIVLAQAGKAVPVFIDESSKDYEGICLTAESFAEDIELVTGVKPEVITGIKTFTETLIIAGTIEDSVIKRFMENGKINVEEIKGKRECYVIHIIDNPMENAGKAVVIAGSDKRGTAYGMYHISQDLAGVSPWVYWGDVMPPKQSRLSFSVKELETVSAEPLIKYRGIFLNDEAPSLTSFVKNAFGDYNEDFYKHVFELILRLKGNYLWPAMWANSFSEDGKSKPSANAEMADKYGVVMGASHHEPMYRAGEEWQRKYAEYSTSNEWNFFKNGEAITNFWEDGLKRNKDYENVITIGMRGECDSSLEGSIADNIQNLKNVITVQKGLLEKYNLAHKPQMLAVYKEVETYWYGTKEAEGLKNWPVLDDVTIMLCEDNFGNLRTLPKEEVRNRTAGWGMYYHFDYHGGPTSYEWINTVPLAKIWDNMTMAYDYGIDNIWIVNVGDLKPMEFPVSYFLDLAYDYKKWGINGQNRTGEYTEKWVKQQFGMTGLSEEDLRGIAQILSDYTRINGRRKPEIISRDTFSAVNYNEAQRILAEMFDLERRADKYYEQMPEQYKDTYFQLVYYPAAATANVNKMYLFAGLNDLYYKRGSMAANTYAELVKDCIARDIQLQEYYNEEMSGGKWKGIMSSPHVGYVRWNSGGWSYPEPKYVSPQNGSVMIVDVEGTEAGFRNGEAELPDFTDKGRECYAVTVSNGGKEAFDYSVTAGEEWILISPSGIGRVSSFEKFTVSVDWNKVPENKEGNFVITGAGETVDIKVKAIILPDTGLPEMTFLESHGVISIEAEHYSSKGRTDNGEWVILKNYGRMLSSAKIFPTTVSFEPGEGPYLEYTVQIPEEGEYNLTVYVGPSNNVYEDSRVRYAISVNGSAVVTRDTLDEAYLAGGSRGWSTSVEDAGRQAVTTHAFKAGINRIRVYGVDAGLIFQKLVISKKALKRSYFGPPESYYVPLQFTPRHCELCEAIQSSC